MKISVVSAALVVVIFAALFHNSSAIRCYECLNLERGGDCDDPFDKDRSNVTEASCPSTFNACLKAKGRARLTSYGLRKNTSSLSTWAPAGMGKGGGHLPPGNVKRIFFL